MNYHDEDMFLFGKETAGLPRDFIAEHEDTAIRIPMSADTRLRSFNSCELRQYHFVCRGTTAIKFSGA